MTDLIKRCPRHYIAAYAQKLLCNGQKPEYLDMYLGMIEYAERKRS